MSIRETTSESTSVDQKTPSVFLNPAWNTFFAHFAKEPTKEQKKNIIDHCMFELSSIIQRDLRRMKEVQRKIRRESCFS